MRRAYCTSILCRALMSRALQLVLALCLLGLALCVAFPVWLPGVETSTPACRGAFGNITRCLPPESLTYAERQLTVEPIRPIAVVRERAHLPLTGLVLEYATRTKRIVGLGYSFGPDNDGEECVQPATHGWVDVYETVGRNNPPNDGVYLNLICATLTEFDASVPSGNLSVSITSNLPRGLLYQVGMDVLEFSPASHGTETTTFANLTD